MFYRAISVVLVAVLVHGSLVAQDQLQSPAQTVAKMQQVLHEAQEKDKAVRVTLRKNIDNQKKFSGKVSDISDIGFVVTDRKTGKIQKLAYEDVREVNQKGMSKGSKVAIGIAVGAAALIGVGLIVCYADGQYRD